MHSASVFYAEGWRSEHHRRPGSTACGVRHVPGREHFKNLPSARSCPLGLEPGSLQRMVSLRAARSWDWNKAPHLYSLDHVGINSMIMGCYTPLGGHMWGQQAPSPLPATPLHHHTPSGCVILTLLGGVAEVAVALLRGPCWQDAPQDRRAWQRGCLGTVATQRETPQVRPSSLLVPRYSTPSCFLPSLFFFLPPLGLDPFAQLAPLACFLHCATWWFSPRLRPRHI